jgi:hypothetical protein
MIGEMFGGRYRVDEARRRPEPVRLDRDKIPWANEHKRAHAQVCIKEIKTETKNSLDAADVVRDVEKPAYR